LDCTLKWGLHQRALTHHLNTHSERELKYY
jgi:hypothetical protein